MVGGNSRVYACGLYNSFLGKWGDLVLLSVRGISLSRGEGLFLFKSTKRGSVIAVSILFFFNIYCYDL